MFYFTNHTLDKMDGLGLDKREVERVIIQGMKWKEEKTDKWHAQMAGTEVVFMKEEKNLIIITVYRAGREL